MREIVLKMIVSPVDKTIKTEIEMRFSQFCICLCLNDKIHIDDNDGARLEINV